MVLPTESLKFTAIIQIRAQSRAQVSTMSCHFSISSHLCSVTKLKQIIALVLLAAIVVGCATRKRNRCNTCPKWTYECPAPVQPQFHEVG